MGASRDDPHCVSHEGGGGGGGGRRVPFIAVRAEVGDVTAAAAADPE